MTTTGIRRGHIVYVRRRVSDRGFFALVVHRHDEVGRHSWFDIKPITPGISYRTCSANEVAGHFRPSAETERKMDPSVLT